MASRKDYAKNNRGKASASRAKSPAKKAPAKKRFPRGLLAITLFLIAGLGYGLYSLTQIAPDKATTPLTNAKPTEKKQEKPKKAEPAPHVVEKSINSTDSNRFEFYDMLKKSEVEAPQVDAYKSTPRDAKSEHSYLLQAGSFKSKADAERMRAQLILLGLPNVHTNTSTSDNGTLWYRVRLGPFENRSRLSKAYDKLVQQNIQPLRIKQK